MNIINDIDKTKNIDEKISRQKYYINYYKTIRIKINTLLMTIKSVGGRATKIKTLLSIVVVKYLCKLYVTYLCKLYVTYLCKLYVTYLCKLSVTYFYVNYM